MDLLVGDLEGDFNGDVVGLSVVGETVGFLVGGAVFRRLYGREMITYNGEIIMESSENSF